MAEKGYIFGIHALQEALDAGKDIDKIFVKKGLNSPIIKEILNTARERDVPVQYVPVEKLNRITRKNHQGILAWISPVSYQDIAEIISATFEQGKVPAVLILDEITDTRNFGAIARTAECAGFDALVVPIKGAAPITPDAIKTSAGALHKIPVCRVHNLAKTVQFLQNCGLKVVAATEKAAQSYREVSYKDPIALVMGAEDTGVSTDILRLCDEMVKIPMVGTISSLNVAVASGIFTFEVVHQREV